MPAKLAVVKEKTLGYAQHIAMRYDTLEGWKRQEYDRRMILKHGELVTVNWTELVDEPDPEGDGNLLVPVERSAPYYVGKLTAGQTGNIIAAIVAVLVNGKNIQEMAERTDNLAFLEVLDENTVTLLVATILDEKKEWVNENWDLTWVAKVALAWWGYNKESFFGLMKTATAKVGGLGMTPEQLRSLALGSPLPAST